MISYLLRGNMDSNEALVPVPSVVESAMSVNPTQLPRKRNLSMDSSSEDDYRQKILKESTSPSTGGIDEHGLKVGNNLSIIDLSESVSENGLNRSGMNDSTLSHKNLSQELNEATSGESGIKDPRRDYIFKSYSVSHTSTPTRQTPSLLSNFVKNMFSIDRKVNLAEPGFSLGPSLPTKARSKSTEDASANSIEENTLLTQENNRWLKEIAKVLEGVGKTVGGLQERLDHLESHVDNSVKRFDESFVRVDKQLVEANRQIEVLSGEVTAKADEAKHYTDDKLLAFTKELPTTLALMGDDVDKKIAQTTKTLLQTIEERVGVLPTVDSVRELVDQGLSNFASKHSLVTKQDLNERLGFLPTDEAIKGLCEQSVNTYAYNHSLVGKADFDALVQRLDALEKGKAQCNTECTGNLQAIKESVSELSRNNDRLHQEFTEKLSDAYAQIDQIKKMDHLPDAFSEKSSWHDFRKRAETALDKFPKWEHQLSDVARSVTIHDMKHRRCNIIIDHLAELPNEVTVDRVNSILDVVLEKEIREKVQIAKAYRLGRKNQGNLPRKILLEMRSVEGRDLILTYAREISKAGNDGRSYYLNEDLPEAEKRRRSDIHKYMEFMKRKKHVISREGDELIIDNVRWRICDLNNLPPGQRLLDSRTIFNRGVVAFQSHLSPLSNLFPCTLKLNGQVFPSLEHAYQYKRAICHGRTDLAADIMCDDDPYVALSQGKQIYQENLAWATQKLTVMENLLRHKEDQCSAFRNTLRSTDGHALVENTWNTYWGSGCQFACEAVWKLQFKGANNLGKLLESIREST